MTTARTDYDYNSPNIYKDDKNGDKINVLHNHARYIDYDGYTFFERGKLKYHIDHQSTKIKGCIAFFKTVAEKSSDVMLAAHAAAAYKEDESRLVEFKKHKPWP
jgi:hypothetical protein